MGVGSGVANSENQLEIVRVGDFPASYADAIFSDRSTSCCSILYSSVF